MSQLSLSDHASQAGIDKWCVELGIPPAPVRVQNLQVALRFLATEMPTLKVPMAVNFLVAMDLSRPVRALTLKPGEPVIAFRTQTESPFKIFFGRPGGSAHDTGINDVGRGIVRYKVRVTAAALESFTTGAIDSWTPRSAAQKTTVAVRAGTRGVMAAGGGLQLIIPRSFACLTVQP